jgi:peptidoglycan hydrolase-like protein with peptidoglycan-binding domain
MRTWTPLASITAFLLMATAVGAQIGSSSTAAQTQTNEAHRAGLEQVQQALRQKGHDPSPVDGVMGPQTIAAVKAFQKEHGLTPTGQLDPSTLARLGMRGTASDRARGRPESDGTQRPGPSPTQTGGDTQPSPADPAQAHKTGGNVGEGASYSRGTEKPAPDPRPK